MIVKVIDTNQCTDLSYAEIKRAVACRSDANKIAFMFEDDSVPDFFKDKTSYTYEQFIAMTKDPSDAWYIA